MGDVFRLDGEYVVGPARRDAKPTQDVLARLDFVGALKTKTIGRYELLADGPVSVDFGSLASAQVVILQTIGKVSASITSADGAAQVVPVDPIYLQITSATPVTAIDVTRVAGVDTIVEVFLGERQV